MSSVLIVEDDARMSAALSGEVKRLGYQVFNAVSCDTAMEILFTENVDVLLTDLRMAGRDGIELIERAKSASPNTRAILMSAYASAKDYRSAIAHGAVDVLSKPFKPEDLERAIVKALDCHQGFQGTVHGVELTDLLQMFHLARRSVTLHLGEVGGTVHLDAGTVVHATCGEQRGVDALRAMLAVRSGSIHTTPYTGAPQTITEPLEKILLDLTVEEDTSNAARSLPAAIADPAELRPEPVTTVEPAPVFDPLEVDPLPPARRSRGAIIALGAFAAIAAAVALLMFGGDRPPNPQLPKVVERPPAPVREAEPVKVVEPAPAPVEEKVEEKLAEREPLPAEPAQKVKHATRRAAPIARSPAKKSEPAELAVESTPVEAPPVKKPSLGIVDEPAKPSIGIVDEKEKPHIGTLED